MHLIYCQSIQGVLGDHKRNFPVSVYYSCHEIVPNQYGKVIFDTQNCAFWPQCSSSTLIFFMLFLPLLTTVTWFSFRNSRGSPDYGFDTLKLMSEMTSVSFTVLPFFEQVNLQLG